MLIEVICKECGKAFMADSREINRGHAQFCSISCAIKYRNKTNPYHKRICVQCGKEFESKSTKVKYCCKSCKYKYYRSLMKTELNDTKKLQDILKELPCENCGWNIGPRDVHHIIPVSEGGKNEFDNLITLCPNCHRLAHRNLLSKDKLIALVNLRTISSSYDIAA